jgi:hypothetical protein
MDFLGDTRYVLIVLDIEYPLFQCGYWAKYTKPIEYVCGECELQYELIRWTKWREGLGFPAGRDCFLGQKRVYFPKRPWGCAIWNPPEFICNHTIPSDLDMEKAELALCIVPDIINQL